MRGEPNERYALLVGIEDYPGNLPDLQGMRLNVEEMHRVLMEVFQFSERNIVVLLDENATREHVIAAFTRHLGQAGRNGVAVFFYAGHGMQLDTNDALEPPLDEEADGVDEAMQVWNYGDTLSYIVDDELGVLADRLDVGSLLIILESCNSGTGTRGDANLLPERVRYSEVRERIKEPQSYLVEGMNEPLPLTLGMNELLSQPRRHVLLAAAAADQLSYATSLWPDGEWRSVFAHYLNEALRETRGMTTFEELVQLVQADVATFAEPNARKQDVQLEGMRRREIVAEFLGIPRK